MKFWLGILFCCLAYGTSAQTDAEISVVPPQRKYDSIRSINIKPYPDHFFVWPVLKQRRLDFEMEDLPARNRKIAYRSNRPYGFGMGVYLFEVAAELTFSVPVAEKQKDLYGESKARDLQLNILGKQWGLDVYHQRYDGFYIDDPSAKVPAGKPYPQRPDITTRNLGFTGNYVFNNKKFSFRSATTLPTGSCTARDRSCCSPPSAPSRRKVTRPSSASITFLNLGATPASSKSSPPRLPLRQAIPTALSNAVSF